MKSVWLVVAVVLFAGSTWGQWYSNTAYDRQTIVHLFEWKWSDIAAECERYLGPNGFGGVQVSPPNEHRVIYSPSWDTSVKRPWYERYQPVSYKLDSRSGSSAEFADMVSRCNNVGVRIYVDAVINHMLGEDAGEGYGIAGSYYKTSSRVMDGVPFGSTDFNPTSSAPCSTGGDIADYGDANQVRNCKLVGLLDLALGKDYVRGKIRDFLNNCINVGVAGFRVDASKHMWPGDMQAIFNGLNDLNTQWFPSGSRALIFQEVIDLGGEPITGSEYTHLGRVTEFKYGMQLAYVVRGKTQAKHLSNWGEGWGFLTSGSSLAFVDNHDNQRGHGAGGQDILTFWDSRLYKIANAFMLAHPYGLTRLMSSYYWDRNFQGGKDKNDWIGPPHNADYSTMDVSINSDGTCGNGWVCEHRWRQIKNMVKFRNVAYGQDLENWWDNDNNQIAFSRGKKAFIAINLDWNYLQKTFYTGLPAGTYCDIISGDYSSGSCSGNVVNVDSSGNAYIEIDNSSEDPVVAIHVEAMLGYDGGDGGNGGGGGGNPPPDPVTDGPPPEGYQRTVIFIEKQTSPGQDLFIRGGISHEQRSGCTQSASSSACAIPILHNIGGTNAKYNSWKSGDSYLDWYGAESGQSSYNGDIAEGTPLVWTTNSNSGSSVDKDGVGYTPLNQWGEHYWMVDVDMDCDQTEGGWFELKAYLKGGDGWESDINQSGACTGTAGGSRPYSTNNHMARCGKLNKFSFNSWACQIDDL